MPLQVIERAFELVCVEMSNENGGGAGYGVASPADTAHQIIYVLMHENNGHSGR